jgi:hypothetical protein
MLGRHRPVRRPDPLNLALGLQKNGVNIIGTSPRRASRSPRTASSSRRCSTSSRSPNRPTASPPRKPRPSIAQRLGYPVLVRPSFVLGGRAMQIVYSDAELQHYMRFAVEASRKRPVLVDKFLEDATEVDVDCIADVGTSRSHQGTIVIGALLEHIEFAGVHSGDAAMVLPPHTLPYEVIQTIREYTHAMARELGRRPHERPIRRQGRHRLRARGQPARLPHRPLRQQGHRRALGQTRRQSHGRPPLKNSVSPGNLAEPTGPSRNPSSPSTGFTARTSCSRPKCGPPARSWASTPISARPTPNRKWPPTPPCPWPAARVHQRQRQPQASSCRRRPAVRRPRFRAHLHQRHRHSSSSSRPQGAAHLQTPGRPSQRHRSHEEPRDPTRHQHPFRPGPRADEVRIRTTAVYTGIPIMTTLSGARAAALAIAALKKSGYSVQTLQEYH